MVTIFTLLYACSNDLVQSTSANLLTIMLNIMVNESRFLNDDDEHQKTIPTDRQLTVDHTCVTYSEGDLNMKVTNIYQIYLCFQLATDTVE